MARETMGGKLLRFTLVGGLALVLAACAANSQRDDLSVVLKEAAQNAEQTYDYEIAIGHYATLYEREPDNTDALLGLARNLRYASAQKDAIKVLTRGIKTHGELPELVLELGKAQFSDSRIIEALATIEKARELASGSWDPHSALAILYDRLGRFGDAQVAYRRALELSPDNAAVLNNLALSLAQQGRLDYAIKILEKVQKSDNPSFQARQNLVLLYALKGDFKRAARLAKQDLPRKLSDENLALYKRILN